MIGILGPLHDRRRGCGKNRWIKTNALPGRQPREQAANETHRDRYHALPAVIDPPIDMVLHAKQGILEVLDPLM